MDESSEILFADKPKGITSFDVIRLLRKKLGIKKMGHAGTLDPFATGLLIVGIGEGTKRLNEYMGLPKTYVMDVLLGRRTDTGDPEGMTLEEKEVKEIDESLLKKILKEMEGEIELPIPKYSAVKHKGIPLYAYARKNILVEEKLRTTRIFYLKLLGIEPREKSVVLKIEMKCEKGTYARAVGEEIGGRLGVPAMLENLRRTKIGDIDVSKAEKLVNDII
ncbi:MAG: tRNA pseudouridine(55) synthase TruB [Candidatus Liptonbacteria bacterium]|nr:tRNA pseudouridine(55) synthase TruB [Candidatus Liptonbacteria bacterium]